MQHASRGVVDLDIHKKIIVACSITQEGKEIQSFVTVTEVREI